MKFVITLLNILSVLNILNLIYALHIHCDFKVHPSYGYGCEATSLDVSRQFEIESINNLTSPDDSIEYFSAKSDNITEFPNNLEKFFPKLKTIKIDFPQLRKICGEDLKVFGESVRKIVLQNSAIECITDDLFASTPNIVFIFLKSSKDVTVGKDAFTPLNKLTRLVVDFDCPQKRNIRKRVSKKLIVKYKTFIIFERSSQFVI